MLIIAISLKGVSGPLWVPLAQLCPSRTERSGRGSLLRGGEREAGRRRAREPEEEVLDTYRVGNGRSFLGRSGLCYPVASQVLF